MTDVNSFRLEPGSLVGDSSKIESSGVGGLALLLFFFYFIFFFALTPTKEPGLYSLVVTKPIH